jgi:tRNA pseudouridine38-40 synthase
VRFTVKLTLEYEGSQYHGWQRQQPALPTLQGILEEALSRITREEISLTGAGRTDAGVHAAGQVAHFTSDKRLEEDAWVRAINSLLPRDVAVHSAEYVPSDFHARYSALSKVYEYRILNQPLRSVFLRTGSWHVPIPLQLEPMRQAACFLLGTHDFSAFRAAECGAKSPVRTLQKLTIEPAPPTPDPRLPSPIVFTFEAGSFLHHMVRNIVGTLVEIGKGKIPPEEIEKILEGKDRRRAGPTAPAQGLWLMKVNYPE